MHPYSSGFFVSCGVSASIQACCGHPVAEKHVFDFDSAPECVKTGEQSLMKRQDIGLPVQARHADGESF